MEDLDSKNYRHIKIVHAQINIVTFFTLFIFLNLDQIYGTPDAHVLKTSVEGNSEPPPWSPWIVSGPQQLVVILVEFQDVKHSVSNHTVYNRIMNMCYYFEEISYGKISINASIYADHWEVLNNTMAYYGEDDVKFGYTDKNSWFLLIDSITAWIDEVNFSLYDNLIVIHAGEDQSSNENRTELLWRQNYCSFGRFEKRTMYVKNKRFEFWGMAYDSEFEEMGLIAHEFGHSLGLPDLYVDNKSTSFDYFSLMARGDRLGDPEGTTPCHLDGWSKMMLKWLTPLEVKPKEKGETFIMEALESNSGLRLIKIPLTIFEYYLIEVRQKTGYDSYFPYNISLIITFVNSLKESLKGIVTIPQGGILIEGRKFEDSVNNIFVSFVSVNGSSVEVKVASKIMFITFDIPQYIEAYSPFTGLIYVIDRENRPVTNLKIYVLLDGENYTMVMTNVNGKSSFSIDFGLESMGIHSIKLVCSAITVGDVEKEVEITFPYTTINWLLFIGLCITLIYIILSRLRERKRRFWG